MDHLKAARLLRITAAAGAVVLTALRVVTLRFAFDENGLLPRGSLLPLLTVAASALVFGALCFLSLRLNSLPGTEGCFSQSPLWLRPKLAAVAMVLLGGVLTFLDGQLTLGTGEELLALAEIAAALLMLVTALRFRREAFLFWFRLIPALFVGASLIVRFRTWSHDPMVIHIVPALLAWTCCMVETMLLSGFSLNAGHRRSAVLFGLGAGVFGCMAAPDYFLGSRLDLPDLLALLGLGTWCAVYALELLRNRVQTEEPAPVHGPEEGMDEGLEEDVDEGLEEDVDEGPEEDVDEGPEEDAEEASKVNF